MPQIWLSYDELADYLGCAGPAAANFAASAQWPRRRCSDGMTRAKLPPAEAEAYLRHYFARLQPDARTDLMVAALEAVLGAARKTPRETASLYGRK